MPPDFADAPEVFRSAVASLSSACPRPELRFAAIPAPTRLASWAYAWELELVRPGDEIGEVAELTEVGGGAAAAASGRLVLLYEPDPPEAWGGTLRLVSYVRVAVDAELARDPLLPAVGWSWLTDSLRSSAARHTALGGTVTQTSSARFGEITGPAQSDELELRASWTPLGGDFTAHADAFCELVAAAAGLPPAGVVALGKQHS